MKRVSLPDNFTFEDMEKAYFSVKPTSAPVWPAYIIVNPKTMSYIKSKFQSSQRYGGPTPLWTGLKYNNATILSNRYAPGNTFDMVGTWNEVLQYDEYDDFTEWVKEVRNEQNNQR